MTSSNDLDTIIGTYPRAATDGDADEHVSRFGVPRVRLEGCRMRCSCQLSRPSRRESSVIRLTAAVAVTILLLVGGATVMIWNARDLMETLSWQGGANAVVTKQVSVQDWTSSGAAVLA